MLASEFLPAVSEPTKRLFTLATVWIAIAAGGIYLYFLNPASGLGFLPCPFRLLTGFQCPGCGTLRGLHQLLHLHPIAAFELNPLMVLMLPFILYSFAGYNRFWITGRPQRRRFIPSKYLWTFLGVLIFFWVFRNTSLYPFNS